MLMRYLYVTNYENNNSIQSQEMCPIYLDVVFFIKCHCAFLISIPPQPTHPRPLQYTYTQRIWGDRLKRADVSNINFVL